MSQFELKPAKGSLKNRKRIGRGPGSGQGCTAGRGMNGQMSRSGSKKRPWFEGGQMPLQRRVPKRGFTNIFRKEYQVVNVSKLDVFSDGETVTLESLYEKGVVSKRLVPVKILGDGELGKKLEVKVAAATKSAVDKITKAGGTFSAIAEEKAKNSK